MRGGQLRAAAGWGEPSSPGPKQIRAMLIQAVLTQALLTQALLTQVVLIRGDLRWPGLRWPGLRRGFPPARCGGRGGGPVGMHQPVGVDRLAGGLRRCLILGGRVAQGGGCVGGARGSRVRGREPEPDRSQQRQHVGV